jgi:hypothetical protein
MSNVVRIETTDVFCSKYHNDIEPQHENLAVYIRHLSLELRKVRHGGQNLV